MEKITLNFETPHLVRALFARQEENLVLLGETFGVQAVARDNFIRLAGPKPALDKARRLLNELARIVEEGKPLSTPEFKRILSAAARDENLPLREVYGDRIQVSSPQQYVRPQTRNQKRYVDAIRSYDAVIAIGPAGTGKTYLAMAMGVSALLRGDVKRLVLTRPARETGEKLGFLPGDLYQKIWPYLRPLYDALYDMMEVERIRKYEEQGIIEIAPLAFMRGRTINNAFIILDEAQNTTPEQMKMFLTRIGFNSKTVVTGDITQVDLPRHQASGLIQARNVLKSVPGIEVIVFTEEDVVRHPLVQEIIRAYDRAEKEKSSEPGNKKRT